MGMTERFAGKQIYLDANVFIYAIEVYPKYSAIATELMTVIDAKILYGVTSELTLAELLVVPLRNKAANAIAAYEAIFLPGQTSKTVAVTRSVLRRSASIRAEFGGKLPDAIHVASAVEAGCSALIATDKRLKAPPTMNVVLLDDLV